MNPLVTASVMLGHVERVVDELFNNESPELVKRHAGLLAERPKGAEERPIISNEHRVENPVGRVS